MEPPYVRSFCLRLRATAVVIIRSEERHLKKRAWPHRSPVRRKTISDATFLAARGSIPLTYMMSLGAMIFAIGVAGVIIGRNILMMFMWIELMLNAVNLAFIANGSRLGSMDGQVIVFFVMTVAAAESAIGLGIIISTFRNRETVHADDLTLMRW